MATRITAFILFAVLVDISLSSSPCYNHQTDTYSTQFSPTKCGSDCTVTPFFSPDHSVDAYLSVINSAQNTLDLFTPGFKSWDTCTKYSEECGGKCIGCTVEDQANEPFPIFTGLANAVKSNTDLKIRIVLNDFSGTTCDNMTTPLDWLHLNDISIRHYKTTTFQHSKFMIADGGKRVLVSSVNFSKTSFTRNREAGVILTDCNCPLMDMYQKVFDSDWDKGYDYKLTSTYHADIKEYITANRQLTIGNTGPYPVKGAFVTSMNDYKGEKVTLGYTSPDNGRDTFMSGLESAKESLMVHIYQITDSGICDKLLDMHKAGINVTLLVGSFIVSKSDYYLSNKCYAKLYKGGMKGSIQKTYTSFSFSHQKYWIVDGTTVHLSTGNWSPSDFPTGTSFPAYKTSHHSVNRDMLVVMESTNIVGVFKEVFDNDWNVGYPFKPKV